MDQDQALRNVGPDLRIILFDTQHHFCGKHIVWHWMTLILRIQARETLSILQIVQERLEGTVRTSSNAERLPHLV